MLFIDRHRDAAGAVCSALEGGSGVAELTRELKMLFGREALALCSVDAALHTALALCGVRDGDYVLVPTFTFYSYIATVAHIGAVPVFLDCDPVTRCISSAALETALMWAELQNKPPRAVIVDNAFGSVADYDSLSPICKAWNVPLVELCCDAFFGNYKQRRCGTNGDFGILGFDKRLIGGGGALLCDRDDLSRARQFSRFEYSDGVNHDYRMHGLIAALDSAQLDAARKISARAAKNLAALCAASDLVAPPVDGDAGVYALCRVAARATELQTAGFEVKMPPPVHTLPQYSDCHFFEHEPGYPVCLSFADHCLVGMDMSIFKRKKLIGLFAAFEKETVITPTSFEKEVGKKTLK